MVGVTTLLTSLAFNDYCFCIVPFLYTFPTMVLSIFEIAVIVRANMRKGSYSLKSSFYIIFAIDTVWRIIMPITFFLCMRMPQVPMFYDYLYSLGEVYNFWTQFVPVLTYYCMFACEWMNLLLTFNRFTVFWLKHKYTVFWRRNLKWLLLVFLSIPLAPSLPLFTEIFTLFHYDFGQLTWDHKIKPKWSNSNSAMLMFGLTAVPALVMNIWLCLKLIKSRREGNLTSTSGKTDFRLWVLTALMFVLTFITTFIQLTFNIPGLGDYMFAHFTQVMYIQFALFDITVLSPSWIILWTSSTFRAELRATITFRKVHHNIGDQTSGVHSQVRTSFVRVNG
uniref:Serpentine receptor class gamma n=1 Tax=Panagrellus redivivus TaxID=6233 RepID=A0A7E4UU26_PANRE